MTVTELARPGGPGDGLTQRWMGVGRSDSPDPATAGAAAADEALAGRDARLVMVMVAYTYDLDAVLGPIRQRLSGDAMLVGCTTKGHFASSAPPEQDVDTGVVVISLGGEELQVAAALVIEVSDDRRGAGSVASQVMDSLTLEHQVCLLLADGFTGEQHEIVRGSYHHLGAAVPVVGGCSGANLGGARSHQFLGSRDGVRMVSDGLVAVGIASGGPIGVGVGHGLSRVDEPFLVTSSAGGRIVELDDRPALDVYLEAIGVDRAELGGLEDFRRRASAHPLGISRRSGEDIRVLHSADLDDGSLLSTADIPQGSVAWRMRADASGLVSAVSTSMDRAFEALHGRPPIGVVSFDCGVRRAVLGAEGVRAELTAMFDPGVPCAGFYTYGEIARTQGARGMHHLTLVTLALS